MRAALRRHLLTDGAQGSLPDWYPVLRAARYLGVSPWLLIEQPYAWTSWALTSEYVEDEVRKLLDEQARES